MDDADRGERGTWRYFASWRGGQIELGATAADLPVDDFGAGRLIMAERPGQIYYVPEKGIASWFIWDGKCLPRDDSSLIGRMVPDYANRVLELLRRCREQVVAELALQLDGATDAQRRTAFAERWGPFEAAQKYHHRLKSQAGKNALVGYMADLAGTSERVLADRWPELVNLDNGIYDPRAGVLYPHDPRSMMTYCLPTPFVPGAQAPEFAGLLWHVAGENANVARHLLKVLGYAMLGKNPERKIVFLSGPTASGKTVLLDVVRTIMGPLARSSGGELIAAGKHERNARVENSLRGRRLVTITETAEQMWIDEGQVKRLTGETSISHHRHYAAEEVETDVTWLIIVATNEMPTLTQMDGAMRQRMMVIPCGETVPDELQDKGIKDRIVENEAAGVLAMLVQGLQMYLAEGLRPPLEVAAFTDAYAAEQDTGQAWLEDWCSVMMPGNPVMNGNGDGYARQGDARRSYVAYCRENRIRALPVHAFGKWLRDQPGISWNQNRKRYDGLVIVNTGSRMAGDDRI
jgi:P4 family phage/plasmid primase-like protien